MRTATNELIFQLCDLWGAPLAGGTITEHLAGSAEVERALNDLRTADVTVDIYHPVGQLVQKPLGALARVVKAFYNPTKAIAPIFTGVLLEPDWKGKEATLQLSAVDAPIRLQKAYLATPYSTPIGGRDIGLVMADLLGRAANRPYPIGSPGLGISIGTIEATYLINREYDAGENIWDALVELSQLAGAPDIDFAPLDRTDGVLWQFNAWAPMGDDVSTSAWFEYNTGFDNCDDMEYTPSGDPVNNYYTALGAASDDSVTGGPLGYAKNDASIARAGIYEGWDSNDATDVLVERAKASEMVSAYNDPPDYITITPRPEGAVYPMGGVPPRFEIDYSLGYTVRAIGRKGTMNVDVLARLQSDRLVEDDETGALHLELDVAPNVDPTGTVTF